MAKSKIKHADLIQKLAERAPEWMEYFSFWIVDIKLGLDYLKDNEAILDYIQHHDFFDLEYSEIEENVDRMLKFLWHDNPFGGIGQGSVSQRDVILYRKAELYEITKQMLTILRTEENVNTAYWNSAQFSRDGKNMKAAKLRVLAALSGLKTSSILYDRLYNETINYLGIPGRFPDASLQKILSEYLTNDFKEDQITTYIFPWVVYATLVGQKQELEWLIKDIEGKIRVQEVLYRIKDDNIIYEPKNDNMQTAALIIALLRGGMQAIDFWQNQGDRTKAKKAIREAKEQTNDPVIQEEAKDLMSYLPESSLNRMNERITVCFTRWENALDDDQFMPDEINAATRALSHCICRELNRLKMANGNNLPTKTLNKMWNDYGCKDNLN